MIIYTHFLSDFGFLHECMRLLFDFNKITPKFIIYKNEVL